jgi:hypothetical protein
VVIPATYNNCRVTTIANGCFKGNADIVSVEIPVGVTTIGSLAFMNCTSLEKVVIPATVTSIGANAFFGFKGSIYCTRDSYAHSYAVDNNIPYVIMDIASTDRTTVDYDNFLVFTTVYSCDDLNDMLSIPSTTLALPVASYIQGNTELYGTGTEISVFDGDDYKGDYKVIVIGDLNGDSVCDVIDAAEAERMSSGQATATTEQIYAANGCISDELDVASYQTVVNNVLAG